MSEEIAKAKKRWNQIIKIATAKMILGQVTQAQLKALLESFDKWKKDNDVH